MPPLQKKNFQAVNKLICNNDVVFCHRERVAAADINNGYTLLNAVLNYKYRMVDLAMTAIGGAASGATDVRISGTQAAAQVDLATVPIAGLTANTFLDLGNAGITVLTAGASLAECDTGTAITVRKTGGTLAGATSVDVVIFYQLIQTRQGA